MLKEFRAFIARGNVLDMAVGIIIGGAFGTIVKTLVDQVIMPPIGWLLGGVDFSDFFWVLKDGATAGPYATLAAAKEAGAVTVAWGMFMNSVVSFLIVAAAVFSLIQAVQRLQKRLALEEPTPAAPALRPCPRCKTPIHPEATRCPACTSEL